MLIKPYKDFRDVRVTLEVLPTSEMIKPLGGIDKLLRYMLRIKVKKVSLLTFAFYLMLSH